MEGVDGILSTLNKLTSIRLNEEVYEKIKELSNREDRSINQIINILLKKGLEVKYGA